MSHDLETDKHQWDKGGMAVPMKQFCQALFGITDNVAETNRFAEQEAALQQQPPQDEHVHETTPSVNGEKQVAAMEKRTNPEANHGTTTTTTRGGAYHLASTRGKWRATRR